MFRIYDGEDILFVKKMGMSQSAALNLYSSVLDIPGVGEVNFRKLEQQGIMTVLDLLYYFPYRWEDFSSFSSIGSLRIGDTVTVSGVVAATHKRRLYGRKTIVEVVIRDETGILKLTWFNQPFRLNTYKEGERLLVSGRVAGGVRGYQMNHPVCEKLGDTVDSGSGSITPIYSTAGGIEHAFVMRIIKKVIPLTKSIQEYLPEDIMDEEDLMPLGSALSNIHFPESAQALAAARYRLSFDEVLNIQLNLAFSRQLQKSKYAFQVDFKLDEMKKFLSHLPYDFTTDQKKVCWQIMQDIGQSIPMSRLVEGDVGSGKTVVAVAAMYMTVLSGYQTAFMAPTEILARQHFSNITERLLSFSSSVVGLLLARECLVWSKDSGLKKYSRQDFAHNVRDHQIDIVVGTHALFSDDICFANLAFVCVDEQHRFGVRQRQKIKDKSGLTKEGYLPHFLSMTATPIPRTLALSLYGDLDISVIKSRPAGRKGVQSILVKEKRQEVYDLISSQVKMGYQVFVVCPLVNELGDAAKVLDERKAVMSEVVNLLKLFPDFEIAAIHGKIKREEQESIMNRFQGGAIDVLVASSVIEVGIDIPNATVMIIENAERFGLSQLHQLRGRVGRGAVQSYCLVFCGSKDEQAVERLERFVKTPDGFELAEYDLSIRGPGEFWGSEQSGFPALKMVRLTDTDLIMAAKKYAERVVEEGLDRYPALLEKMNKYQAIGHFE